MKSKLRNAINEYSRDGDMSKLIDIVASIAAAPYHRARCLTRHPDFVRELDEAIKQLLAGDERELMKA